MLTHSEFQSLFEQGSEAVWTVLEALQTTLLTQHLQIETLTARVQELENRLGKDSHNSSKPPSSDGLAKKPVSLRKPSGRKPGGQPGHKGRTLTFSETPDTLVVHSLAVCAACQACLAQVEAGEGERRQVVDLPPAKLIVTEHHTPCKVCPACGHKNQAAFPPNVTQRVQYGPRIAALGVYLSAFQLLPYARISQMFSDLFGACVSSGTLFAFQQRAFCGLSGVVSCIQEGVRKASVAHFDETGFREGGSLHWLHVASTPTLTFYDWHKQRGKGGLDKAGVLSFFTGTAVHDGFVSYQSYGCGHALCNAHHLRELTALVEAGGQEWAGKMRSVLVEIKQAVSEARERGQERLPVGKQGAFERRYQQLLRAGWAANPPVEAPLKTKRGRVKQSAARNLLSRLEKGRGAVLGFMYDFEVPFDNNLAERDLRMMKVKQKVSGCFRTGAGADAFCSIRSYVSTLQKQGQPLLLALEHVFLGTPLVPQIQG